MTNDNKFEFYAYVFVGSFVFLITPTLGMVPPSWTDTCLCDNGMIASVTMWSIHQNTVMT